MLIYIEAIISTFPPYYCLITAYYCLFTAQNRDMTAT